MSDPIASFSGIASGVQWRDLLDQIMRIDTQRRLDPVKARQSLAEQRVEAWKKYQTLVTKFRDASRALRDSSAFASFKASGGISASTARTLVTASAGVGANPGTVSVEVLDLARANKVSGAVFASASQALGLSGEFAVNGRKVTVVATDTLAMVRDKINALNVGTTASGASATVLSTGAAEHRLVITADQTGASGLDLTDDAGGILQSLGVVDATKTANLAANGGVQSYKISSATAAIATMLGVTLPPPSTIEIGGRVVTVDLTVDSITSIVSRIMAAGGNAAVVSEVQGGKTFYRMVTSDTVTASTGDGQRTLEVLGFVKNGRSGIAQVVKSENTFTNAGGATATSATLLSDLAVTGNALGLVAGDMIAIQGKRGDGSLVSTTFTLGAGDTVQTLLNRLNNATSGFAAGARPASASLVNGQLVLTDGTVGDSQLSLSISATRAADGSVVSLGRQLTDTVGRHREVVAGSNAEVRVDGVSLSRASNTITDAVAGVTLNLQQAEPGTVSSITIERDADALAGKMKDLATAYNDLLAFRTEQDKREAPLHNNSSLRSSLGQLTGSLLSNVVGLTGGLARAGGAGLALQSDGTLKLDDAVFKGVLANSFADLVNLFATGGTSTNGSLSYWSSTDKSVPGTYAVAITAAATTAQVTGSGFSGTYADDATADVLTITDATTGGSASIQLTNGDTIDTIVSRLNTALATNKLAVTASKSGNDLVLTGNAYGSSATFTVAYGAGGIDGTGQLGIAAGTFAGTDVAGTIGGLAATGSGQVLTGASGGVTEGLGVTYTGTATGPVGDLTFILGVSGMLFNAADLIVKPNGTIAAQTDSLDATINQLKTRADTVQQVLERRRQVLARQFVEMERAISRIQSQGVALGNLINSLQALRPQQS
jgi:flagellar hook-associated protein 2